MCVILNGMTPLDLSDASTAAVPVCLPNAVQRNRNALMSKPRSPERPARGLPPEQALERWSDPDAYAAMRELWDCGLGLMFVVPSTTGPREREYHRRRRPLEQSLLPRLSDGDLLSSAVPADADPSGSRTLLDPEVYRHGTLFFE